MDSGRFQGNACINLKSFSWYTHCPEICHYPLIWKLLFCIKAQWPVRQDLMSKYDKTWYLSSWSSSYKSKAKRRVITVPELYLSYSVITCRTKYAPAIAGIARSQWRPEFKHLRRLFIAIAAPRIDYGTIMWHRPEDTRTAPTTSQLQMFSLQGRIIRAITGCFRITAITAMEHETAVLSP